MIIVMKQDAAKDDVTKIVAKIENAGLKTHLSVGEEVTIVGVIGDKTKLDVDAIAAENSVQKVVPITESYKLANKKFHPEPTSFAVKNTFIGPDNLTIMSGPCAVTVHRKSGKKSRCHHSAWRCIQTAYFSVLFPGT